MRIMRPLNRPNDRFPLSRRTSISSATEAGAVSALPAVAAATSVAKTPTTTNNPNTYSIDFERSSGQYLTFSDESADVTSAWTIAFWFKPESLPGTGQIYYYIAKQAGANNNWFFRLVEASGVQYIEMFTRAGSSSFRNHRRWDVTSLIAAGTWVRLRVTVDVTQPSATMFELFVNESSQGNGTAIVTGTSGALAASSTAVTVSAAASATTDNLDGLIDDLRVYNAVVNDAATQSQQLTGGESNLWLYCKFNNALTDSGPNAFSLSEVNGPIPFTTDVAF